MGRFDHRPSDLTSDYAITPSPLHPPHYTLPITPSPSPSPLHPPHHTLPITPSPSHPPHCTTHHTSLYVLVVFHLPFPPDHQPLIRPLRPPP